MINPGVITALLQLSERSYNSLTDKPVLGGTPANPTTSLQFNDAGAFGGAKILYVDSATAPQIKVEDQPTNDTDGYDFSITGSKGKGTDGEPGKLSIIGAPWASYDNTYRFGDVYTTGGSDPTKGQGYDGGRVYIAGGLGDTVGGTGGNVYINGGNDDSASTRTLSNPPSSKSVVVTGGSGGATGDGGWITFHGGVGGSTSGLGGLLEFRAGAGGPNSAGGNYVANAGAGHGTGNGGFASLGAGDALDGDGSGNGGDAILSAGFANGLTGNGGDAIFEAGDGALNGNGNGGNVLLQPGLGNGSGVDGFIKLFQNADSAYAAKLDLSLISSSDKTFTFPNTTGTIALTSNIPTTASGAYSPTFTSVANLDSTPTGTAQYSRNGSVVTVSGQFSANPTSPAAATTFGISLPVASNFANTYECAGTAFAGAIAGMGAAINADTTNDRANVTWVSSDINAQTWSFIFTYLII